MVERSVRSACDRRTTVSVSVRTTVSVLFLLFYCYRPK
jgi:hypothetical protein